MTMMQQEEEEEGKFRIRMSLPASWRV